MSLEETLSGSTGPSSNSEAEKQERTERMIKEAIRAHPAFSDCDLSVFAKGSYANNTNVRADSDVDVAVQCHECVYWDQQSKRVSVPGSPYAGPWTPSVLRTELAKALKAKFPSQVDTTGSTAIRIRSSTARVDADVVPCFDYRYHFDSGQVRKGTKIFKKDGTGFENYPVQHLEEGTAKNARTSYRFKRAVRIMKRVENVMASEGVHREVPSFFVECLVYNCPDSVFSRATWVGRVSAILVHIWDEMQGDHEPSLDANRWVEVNECKYLFFRGQNWTRKDGRDFAHAAWNFLELGS